MVARYLNYGRYLKGLDARPVPPVLFINSVFSRDNSEEVFNEVVRPELARLNPAPKTHLVMVDGSSHLYTEADGADFPLGMTPVAAKLFDDAVRGGFFLA